MRHNRQHLGYRLFVPALPSGLSVGEAWAARPPATRDAAGSVAGPRVAGDGVNPDPEILGSAQALGGGGELESAAAGGRALAGRIRLPGLYCRSLLRTAAAPSSWARCAARDTPTVPFPGSIFYGLHSAFQNVLKGGRCTEAGGALVSPAPSAPGHSFCWCDTLSLGTLG